MSISLNVLVKVTSHHGVLAPTLILDSQYIRYDKDYIVEIDKYIDIYRNTYNLHTNIQTINKHS